MFTKIDQSQTLLLNEQSRLRENSGQKVFKLGFGQSPFLPPINVIKALQNSAIRKDYSPVKGLPELCENVATFHNHYHNLNIDSKDVLICPGSKIAIYNTLLAFENADVLIPAPSWVSYAPQAKLAGHNAHFIETNFQNRWRLTPQLLEEYIAKCSSSAKILILNYPGNPDGLSYSPSELKDIVEILRKHHVWVISDEIYGFLHHEGEHKSIAEFYPERTFITTGLSKWCGAGGWRLGVHMLPKDFSQSGLESIIGIASETYSCAPTPVQVAATLAYQISEETENYLAQQRSILKILGNNIQKKLDVSGINVHAPQGGFYLLVDFSPFTDLLKSKNIHNDNQLCDNLIKETGVALLPGSAFGINTKKLTARLAYVDFDGNELQKIFDSIDEKSIINKCQHMINGIDAICNWIK